MNNKLDTEEIKNYIISTCNKFNKHNFTTGTTLNIKFSSAKNIKWFNVKYNSDKDEFEVKVSNTVYLDDPKYNINHVLGELIYRKIYC